MPNPLNPDQATRLDLNTYYTDFQKEFTTSNATNHHRLQRQPKPRHHSQHPLPQRQGITMGTTSDCPPRG